MLPQEIVDAICEYGDYRGEQFGGAPRTVDPYKVLEAAIEKALAGERLRCAREIAIPETVGEAHRLARGAMAWATVVQEARATKPNPLSIDTIRVWFSGPTTVRDERIVGEYEDLPANTTTAHVYHPDRDPPPWERSTIGTDQDARLSNVWILRGDKWTTCRIEPKIDTSVRHAVDAAVLAERTAAKRRQDALVAIAKLGEREGCAQELIRLLGVCADNTREGAGRTEALLSGVAAIRARA